MLPQGQTEAAVLLVPTIGVRPSTLTCTLGFRASPMASSTSSISTTHLGFVLFGLFNHLTIHQLNDRLLVVFFETLWRCNAIYDLSTSQLTNVHDETVKITMARIQFKSDNLIHRHSFRLGDKTWRTLYSHSV